MPAVLSLPLQTQTPAAIGSSLRLARHVITMSSSSSNLGLQRRHAPVIHSVPGLTLEETISATDSAFCRYSSNPSQPSIQKRTGDGVVIVWFRNDLRILDNEALLRAWAGSAAVLPVYCVDPRCFGIGTTHYFGFPKTGALRAKFSMECLTDLKRNLTKRGLNLLVRNGKPEDVIPSIAKAFGAHTVFAQKETCSEELLVERLVSKALQDVVLCELSSNRSRTKNPKLQLVWGATMYHIDDLPFSAECVPDVYTQFRKFVESKSFVRGCCKLPMSLGPVPSSGIMEEVGGWGSIPSLEDLGVLHEIKCDQGMKFAGGESAALGRVYEYFWKKASVT